MQRGANLISLIMKTSTLVCASFLLLVTWLSLAHAEDVAGQAQSDHALCAGLFLTGDQLRQHIAQSQATLDGLTTFISGSSLGDISAASLFTVDLSDDIAVERRIASLKKQVGASTSGPSIAGLLVCAGYYPQFAQLANDLAALKMRVARTRLDFLSLPKDKRDTLVNTQQFLMNHVEAASELAREQLAAEQQ